MSTGLTTTQQGNFTKLKGIFGGDELKTAIAEAAPRHLTPERAIRVALTSLRRTPKLLECDTASVIKAVIEASQLGLEVDGVLGQAYLVPFGRECQMIIGYRGLIELCRRSGEIDVIKANVVRQDDEFDWMDVPPKLEHKSAGNADKPITHVYAWVQLRNGGTDFVVWSVDEIEAHRKRYSRAQKGSAWETAWDWMAKKTVLRQLCKLLPLSTEYHRAVIQDEYRDTIDAEYRVNSNGRRKVTATKITAAIEAEEEEYDDEHDGQLFETDGPQDAVEQGM